MRTLALAAYGIVCYGASMVALVVLFAWLGGFALLPIRLDEGAGAVSLTALAWNTAIMLGFTLYHSIFARTFVKRRTRLLVGRNLERATYNLVSAVLSVLLCLAWWSIPARLWEVSSPELRLTIQGAYVALWIVHMTSIVFMNHNDFFGLRQIGLAMRGEEYRPLPPVARGYYLSTRLALVISLALIPWASAVMSVGRLQLCVFMTLYTALGAWLSNRDQGDVMTASAPILPPATGKMIAGKAGSR
jgi:methanethiol S-methyltransferase